LPLQKSFNDCDVIIVNYNSGILLLDCVSSVFVAGAARVIVVDNQSTDDSLEHLERVVKNERLVVIRNDKNLGFATACNIGAKISSAHSVLFLNPDAVLAADALTKMVAVLNTANDVGMVGGFLCNPDGTEQPGGRRVFPTPKRAFMRAFGLSRLSRFFPEVFSDFLLDKEPLPSKPIPVEAISGACILVKREAMEDVGLFDTGYFLHCEDLDWCMRFRHKGWKVMFVPDAIVTHLWGACSRNRPYFVEWNKHCGMTLFYKKFFYHQYPGLLWGLVVAGIWFRFVLVIIYYTGRLVLTKI
jgi:GT2 family glycosyltransferase